MRKELLLKFINKHPNHSLISYFQNLIDNDLVEFNTLRDIIKIGTRSELLSPSEIGQTDILMANMSLIREEISQQD